MGTDSEHGQPEGEKLAPTGTAEDLGISPKARLRITLTKVSEPGPSAGLVINLISTKERAEFLRRAILWLSVVAISSAIAGTVIGLILANSADSRSVWISTAASSAVFVVALGSLLGSALALRSGRADETHLANVIDVIEQHEGTAQQEAVEQ